MEEDGLYEGSEGFREWAQAQVSQQHQLFGSMLEQHAALYRWILAARLSINGGATVAILNADRIPVGFSAIALLIFVAGMVTAIIAAELDQKALQASFRFNTDAVAFWSKAAATGKFNAVRLAEIGKQAGVDAAHGKKGKIAGWASVACFIGGAGVIGISFFREFEFLSFCAS